MKKFKLEFLETLKKWSAKESLSIKIETENDRELLVLLEDLKITVFEDQVEFRGPNIYRRFENWDFQRQNELIEEIINNISFYLRHPNERDVLSLTKPNLFLRGLLSRIGIHIGRKLKK